MIEAIPAGAFPRALKVSPDGATLFLSNYDSNTVQIIDVGHIGAPRRRP